MLFKEAPDKHNDSIVFNRRNVKYEFKNLLHIMGDYIICSKDILNDFSKESISDFEQMPIYQKRLGGKYRESSDYRIIRATTELDIDFISLSPDNKPIPRYFPNEIDPYINKDFVAVGGDIVVSKKVYNLLNSEKYCSEVEDWLCYQVEGED
jgi:hypothetical protein